jgi:HlyD family secretion protein
MKRLMAFIFGLSLLLGLAGCEGLGKGTPTPTPKPANDFKPVISATGLVTPAQKATLSLPVSGALVDVLAVEGQTVKAGQALARLKKSESLEAALSAARLELAAAQKGMDDLKRGASLARADAELRLANAEKALDKAKTRRESKSYKHGNTNLVDTARAEYLVAQDGVKKAEDMYSYFDASNVEDVNRASALTVVSQARQRRDQALANLNYLLALPDRFEVGIADGELRVAQETVDSVKAELERLKDGPDRDLLALAKARLENAQVQLKAAEASLKDLDLAAPFDGTVAKLYVRANEWVNPGQPVLMLGNLATLRVETTDLSEIDAARVVEGAPVKVTFDALPSVSVKGKVVYIAPKSAEGSGVNYPVYIEMEELPAQLRWGMTAFVDIEVK